MKICRSNPPIAFDSLLERCMGRIELMERILCSFRATAEREINEIVTAVENHDRDVVQSRAHKLKGTALTVSATSLADVAEQLQVHAQEGDSSTLCLLSVELSEELVSIINVLDGRKVGGAV